MRAQTFDSGVAKFNLTTPPLCHGDPRKKM